MALYTRLSLLGVMLVVAGVGPANALTQVLSEARIGAPALSLAMDASLGEDVVVLGDLDGPGGGGLAIAAGAPGPGSSTGAVWVLFLNSDGSLQSSVEITEGAAGFSGPLVANDRFGSGVAVADVNSDGFPELLVGAPLGGASNHGAMWVIFLSTTGSVTGSQLIPNPETDADHFGVAVEPIGDINGDGLYEIAVGGHRDGSGGSLQGAVWILSVDASGSHVTGGTAISQKITSMQGGFSEVLDVGDVFGRSLAWLGDIDGDPSTVGTLAVGAHQDDDGGTDRGAIWFLSLASDGMVVSTTKMSDAPPSGVPFAESLSDADRMGIELSALGDLDGDGIPELGVGAEGVDDGGVDQGAFWVLYLNADLTIRRFQRFGDSSGCFQGGLTDGDHFGQGVAAAPDLDGDGTADLIAGAQSDDGPAGGEGAVWLLFMAGPAQEVVRLGSPPNPAAFQPGLTTAPSIGASWDPVVTPFLPGAVLDFIAISPAPPLNIPTILGTLLCNVPPPNLIFFSGAGVPFSITIPSDCDLVGLPVCTQGGSLAPGPVIALANAIDLVLGCAH